MFINHCILSIREPFSSSPSCYVFLKSLVAHTVMLPARHRPSSTLGTTFSFSWPQRSFCILTTSRSQLMREHGTSTSKIAPIQAQPRLLLVSFFFRSIMPTFCWNAIIRLVGGAALRTCRMITLSTLVVGCETRSKNVRSLTPGLSGLLWSCLLSFRPS